MKRKTALALLLPAYLILAVHMMIPHHHHDLQVCMVKEHCLNDHKVHDHHHDSNKQECLLNQVLIIPAENKSRVSPATADADTDPYTLLTLDVFSLPPDARLAIIQALTFLTADDPLLLRPLGTPPFVSLRAPPLA